MITAEIDGGGAVESKKSPNPGLLKEFVAWATDMGAKPHILRAGDKRAYHPASRPETGAIVDSVWVLSPPIEATKYHKAQRGVACTMGGQLYSFEPGTAAGTLTLPADCPAEGQDPAQVDEAWLAYMLDGAEANITAAAEANMSHTEYEAWARCSQASGILATKAA
jgi:hypothetical protein